MAIPLSIDHIENESRNKLLMEQLLKLKSFLCWLTNLKQHETSQKDDQY